MESATHPSFSLMACYAKAWKAFAKWWIPICLIAAGLVVFQLGPEKLAKAESSAISHSLTEIAVAIEQDDWIRVEALAAELNETLLAYAKAVATFSLYAAPIVALLTIVLLCTSIMAVKGRRIRYSPWHILFVALVNTLLAFVKILLVFLFLPLGVYLYIKLYFVSLAMVEEQKNLSDAIQQSWHLSTGHFWTLLGMVALNSILQFAMIPTLIGLIPASGFATTSRAAAYAMLRA